MSTNRQDPKLWHHEGWTVQDFIAELEPVFNMIMNGKSFRQPFKTRAEVKKWCMSEQPFYKRYIPAVVNHFWGRINRPR